MPSEPVRRALLSVADKTGLIEFAAGLRRFGVELLSTGGTAQALRQAGIQLTEVQDFTGFPEMLDGRVKTLHPRVHAGILYRRDDPSHVETMKAQALAAIDLVAVNLYPFEETVARAGVTRAEAIEQIDVGGPCLLRSAAKNHAHVTVIASPRSYGEVLAEMRAHGGATTLALRERLAVEAFRRTAAYDAAIQRYFEPAPAAVAPAAPGAGEEGSVLPRTLHISLPRALPLRYGENPHQEGALYGTFLEHFRKLHGKELSYNNIVDLAAAQEMVECLGRRGPAVVIVKHANPCGAAMGQDIAAAWKKALATDPAAASGGIIACSLPLDLAAATLLRDHFIEVLAAPGFDPEALALLGEKKNRMLLEVVAPLAAAGRLSFRSLPDGAVAQTADDRELKEADLRVVTRRAPEDLEWEALRFGWEVVRFVKSNAIVFAAADRTLGIGAGQMSRLDAARLGAMKARDAGLSLGGCAVASDAFFPFADGLLAAVEAGATAVIQPGGSVRDQEVIAAADARDVAMVFTGVRQFRH